jgi:glyoxylase-like metal-dependent hydrolase (beta-lactamase superfamily II)
MEIFQVGGIGYDSNIYLLKSTEKSNPSALVDAGTGFHGKEVLGRIKHLEKLRKIEAIVLTHEHFDHIGGVPKLIQAIKAKRRKVKVFAHKLLAQALSIGNIPSASFFDAEVPNFEVEVELEGGQEIELGKEKFKAIHTPGHSPSSISLLCEEKKALFCGDLIFSRGGVGRWDIIGGDKQALQNSIQKLRGLEIKGIYPGHGPYSNGEGKEWIELAWLNLKNF